MNTATKPMVELSDEPESIPSVVEASQRKSSWRGMAAIAAALAIVIGVAIFIAVRVIGPKLSVPKADPTEKATAAAAKAPGAARSFAAEVPPPRVIQTGASGGGAAQERFPAADDASNVKPIEVRADGTVVRAKGEGTSRGSAQERSPDDGPVLVALASGASFRQGAGSASSGNSGSPTATESPSLPPTASRSAAAGGKDSYTDLQRALSSTQSNLASMLDRLSTQNQGGLGSFTPPALPAMPGIPSAGGLQPGGLAQPPGAGLFGGQLQSSQTASVPARFLGNGALTLPKGTAFTCALKTKVISAVSGLVGCQVLRNVYSADGRTVLIERGSHLDGEYRITQVRPGVTRIPTIWQRVRTPNGVIVDLESPAVGPLGESGLPGEVDNRWLERIGVALLVALLDDVFRYAIAGATRSDGGNNTVVLSSTGQQAQRLPEKILDSTINIPPTITANQGALVGIYVARDVDFSSVYALRPTRDPQ